MSGWGESLEGESEQDAGEQLSAGCAVFDCASGMGCRVTGKQAYVGASSPNASTASHCSPLQCPKGCCRRGHLVGGGPPAGRYALVDVESADPASPSQPSSLFLGSSSIPTLRCRLLLLAVPCAQCALCAFCFAAPTSRYFSFGRLLSFHSAACQSGRSGIWPAPQAVWPLSAGASACPAACTAYCWVSACARRPAFNAECPRHAT